MVIDKNIDALPLLFTLTSLYRFFLLLNSVQAQLQNINYTTASLSQERRSPFSVSLSDLVFFAGGYNATIGSSDRVDIYNVTSGSWTTATLSVPRYDGGAAFSGSLVFFAGGTNDMNGIYNQVDIYNVSDGSWSTANLSQARYGLAAASVGNLVLFGGGYNGTVFFNVVDIYNVSSNTWTTATLSQARKYLAATSVSGRYALFAGGVNDTVAFNVVDIYDSSNGTWSTTALSQGRGYLAAASLDDLAFFGGGYNTTQPFNIVDIINVTTQMWTTATLSQARYALAAAATGDIVAFGGGTEDDYTPLQTVDIYNVTNHHWFTANLSIARYNLGATSSSSTNQIFFGGGCANNNTIFYDTVDIFTIVPSSSTPRSSLSPFSSFPMPAQATVLSTSSLPMSPLNISPSLLSPNVPQSKKSGGGIQPTSSSTPGVVAGIVVSLIVLIVVAIIIVVILLKKRKKRKQKQSEHVLDDNFAITVQNQEPHVVDDMMNTVVDTATTTKQRLGTETLKATPCEIPFDDIKIEKEIGEGNYGRVCVGKWKKHRVALKFCQNKGKMDEFMREANLMVSLPPHPNVVRLYGVSIDGPQPIIVMEYCAGGSLDKLLFDTKLQISNEQKIRWVNEIAQGMSHLHKFNIVHRDLAARNVLLSHSDPYSAQLKISDFGMSRVLEQDIEGKTQNKMGPIRWMSPESIGQQVYSKKSDVWMFGILVYEIVAQCEPHTDVDHNEVAILIRDQGLTPTIPSNCPEKLRQLMEMCWKKQPEQRPNFETICQILEH